MLKKSHPYTSRPQNPCFSAGTRRHTHASFVFLCPTAAALLSTWKPSPPHKQALAPADPRVPEGTHQPALLPYRYLTTCYSVPGTHCHMQVYQHYTLCYSEGTRRPASSQCTEASTPHYACLRGSTPSSLSRSVSSSTEGRKAVICTTRTLCSVRCPACLSLRSVDGTP